VSGKSTLVVADRPDTIRRVAPPRTSTNHAMNLQDFTDLQRQALLDLALLAMYADGL
jgi:hypothetical protein